MLLTLLLYFLIISTSAQLLNEKKRVEFRAIYNRSKLLEFTNIAVSKERTGFIYVGARNRLFQLNSNLDEYRSPIVTGPVNNNLVCHCETNNQTDNLNKLLLIDYQYDRIISCGSVEQGVCELRSKENLNYVLRSLKQSIYKNDQHVAASQNFSTVAFLALVNNEENMYVGSSKTILDDPILHEKSYTTAATYAIRSLLKDNFSKDMFSSFEVSASDTLNFNEISMKSNFGNHNFRLNFIDAFATDVTGYFVLTHPSSLSNAANQDATYISQLCLDNKRLSVSMSSYLEMPLECTFNEVHYTRAVAATTAKVGALLQQGLSLNYQTPIDVVFVSFVQSNGSPGSALCMFPLPKIEQRFVKFVRDCMETNSNSSPSPISWINHHPLECNRGAFDVQSPLCSSSYKDIWDVVSFLEGETYSKSAVFHSPSTISAIAVTQTELKDHTIAFLGTKNGKLLKMRIDADSPSSQSVYVYKDLGLDPASGTNSDILVVKSLTFGFNDDVSNQRIYAMTPAVIVGLPLFDCSQYKTCNSCLESKDPFCGWCTFENKCAFSGNCEMSNSPTYRFLRTDSRCPMLKSEHPLVFTSTQAQERINLEGYNIPYSKDGYQCSFGDIYSHSVTSVERNSIDGGEILIQCFSPPRKNIPKLSAGAGFVTMPLKLLYVRGKYVAEVARTDFTFYDCTVYTTCLSCLKAQFNCSWCMFENRCTQRWKNECPQENVNQAEGCPQLAPIPPDGKAYLPEGVAQDLTFKVLNLPLRNLQKSPLTLTCEINTGQITTTFAGDRGAGRTAVICRRVKIELPASKRSDFVSLRILYNTDVAIDNPRNVGIEVYRCDLGDSGSCGECLETPEKWQCGWCNINGKGSCRRSASCPSNRETFCRNPRITSFSPVSAPIGGNSTIISLEGVNFDRSGRMLVYIETIRCGVIGSSCCKVECKAVAEGEVSGLISLCISMDGSDCYRESSYSTTTDENFSFVNPQIESFTPSRGLLGWGAVITVRGQHLDTGNSATVEVDGRPCIVTDRKSSQLTCMLACSSLNRRKRDANSSILKRIFRSNKALKVSFDGVDREASGNQFTFEREVSINSISPRRTIIAGGLPLYVKGYNLGLIQDPQFYVNLDKQTYKSDCIILNDTTVRCSSPSIARSGYNNPGNVKVGVLSRHCAVRSVDFDDEFSYQSNPVIEQFDGDEHEKIFRNESLYIAGLRLCPEFCEISTARVFLSDGTKNLKCVVTRLDVDQIRCNPPAAPEGRYAVQVYIGGFSQKVGYLKYTNEGEFQSGPIIAVCVIVAVLAVVIVIFFLKYHRRAKAKDEELKNVQMEMNVMEANVAKACKEGFAELQTEMNELDYLAGGVAIPYLDYPAYLVRIIFPNANSERQRSMLLTSPERADMRSSHWCKLNNNRYKHGLEGLYRLLIGNKKFIFCLVQTFERQSSFQPQHRGQVAGLLLLILHDRLGYVTEILEYLLDDMIRKKIDTSGHPKVMFRSSETVAEKLLSHWLSSLLHTFVVECAGEPLYALYRAIKQQVNKGPVDCITNEAKYSLSEDKLLRGTIDYEPISLRVSNYLSGRDQPEFAVKVLTCDSISQAKRKIVDVAFMNICQSHRPILESVDIEWRPGNKGGLILRDEDSRSRLDGEYRVVNTLALYNVKNNDLVHLIPRKEHSIQSSVTSSISKASGVKRNGSGAKLFQSVENNSSSLPRYMQLSRSGTPTQPLLEEHNLCHLVSPNAQDQNEGTADRANKMVTEIFLTRLLITKGTIQKYVNDLFETIFSAVQRGHSAPIAVKHLFDFLDRQAAFYQTEPEIVHAWKSNCLPLRFWVNLIKNPEFILDIDKPLIVDRYLSVIAQAFMDSCSTADNKLGKDAPSNKLLYAKDIADYQEWVRRYYADIKSMRPINRRDLAAFLQEESNAHSYLFNTNGALMLLYEFIERYKDEILETLDQDKEANRQQLYSLFMEIYASMTEKL